MAGICFFFGWLWSLFLVVDTHTIAGLTVVVFLCGHFNPRDGRRAESVLSAALIPGEAPSLGIGNVIQSNDPTVTLNDRRQQQY